MKNELFKIALKFGLILGGLTIVVELINSFAFNPESSAQWTMVLTGILSSVLLCVCIAMAHDQYNQKNDNYISFKDAILIGLIILGVTYVMATTYSYINYELVLKEKLRLLFDKQSELYGTAINENSYDFGKLMLLSLVGLLTQIVLLFVVITVESLWKIYKKAGKEGWAALVPIYNIIVWLQIVKKPTWWLLLLLIPFVNIIMGIWMTNLLSKRFNKDEGFTIGLLLLPFIFYPLLGMSKAEYVED